MTTEVNQVLGLSSDTFSAEDSMKSPILTSAETFIDQSSSSLSTRTLNKFTLISIIGSALLTGLSLAMIIPVLPKLLLIAVNENSSHAAWITGTVSFAGSCVEIFSNPILGRASDRIGRKPILMLSVLGLLVELLLIGCFYNSVAVYVAARMIASLTGVFFVTLNTIYADIAAGTGEEAYTYGVSGASFGVCFVIGPILGGKLERVHTALAVFASCTLLTLNLFYITFFVPETNTHSIDPDLHNSSDSFIRRISKVSPSVSEINPIPSAAKLLQNPVLKWLALSFMFDGTQSLLLSFRVCFTSVHF
uniref:Major facilitator superfamily (MFS) profile domain-containing protein n=1 Tax=Timspurckia oligopyrenoides TaxID=708627 RepID=A0A7S0ZC56_9RHOD|mmetsp:Transcript_11979/g.21694  ORF Transcript_11979/g.21694 Transcript_11979/m.21694 type:complete len:306 (+) Transcript_11979:71-988(+)